MPSALELLSPEVLAQVLGYLDVPALGQLSVASKTCQLRVDEGDWKTQALVSDFLCLLRRSSRFSGDGLNENESPSSSEDDEDSSLCEDCTVSRQFARFFSRVGPESFQGKCGREALKRLVRIMVEEEMEQTDFSGIAAWNCVECEYLEVLEMFVETVDKEGVPFLNKGLIESLGRKTVMDEKIDSLKVVVKSKVQDDRVRTALVRELIRMCATQGFLQGCGHLLVVLGRINGPVVDETVGDALCAASSACQLEVTQSMLAMLDNRLENRKKYLDEKYRQPGVVVDQEGEREIHAFELTRDAAIAKVQSALCESCRCGSLDLVKCLLSDRAMKYVSSVNLALNTAARNGKSEVLNYIFTERALADKAVAMDLILEATRRGHVQAFESIYSTKLISAKVLQGCKKDAELREHDELFDLISRLEGETETEENLEVY